MVYTYLVTNLFSLFSFSVKKAKLHGPPGKSEHIIVNPTSYQQLFMMLVIITQTSTSTFFHSGMGTYSMQFS